jgi:hypothetical protein
MKRTIMILTAIVGLLPMIGNGQDEQSKQQISDMRIIPGTRWMSFIGTKPDGRSYCVITITDKNDQKIGFTVGSEGTLALLVEDIYLERQISSVMPWAAPGQSYRAILFVDDKKLNVSAMRIEDHGLVVPLESVNIKVVLQAKRVSLAVGSIAMRGYDVDGLNIAIPELQDTARQLRNMSKQRARESDNNQLDSQQAPATEHAYRVFFYVHDRHGVHGPQSDNPQKPYEVSLSAASESAARQSVLQDYQNVVQIEIHQQD